MVQLSRQSAQQKNQFSLSATIRKKAVGGTVHLNTTLSETTVPYYCIGSQTINRTLTINEGITIYVQADRSWSDSEYGKLVVNGTPTKPVTFTRLPGITYYWGTSSVSNSQETTAAN